jgi:O-antigen/teichoic acid export membrane protein
VSTFRKQTGKALIWDLIGSYGGQVSAFIISIFLARLLSPEDFGLVGMSMVFIAMLQVFRDVGFSSALIQNKNNTSITYSSVFYFNLLTGFLLAIAIYFAAPNIGAFYGNEGVTQLLQLLIIPFFVNSLTIVQSTILRKELDFKSLTYRNLISQIVSGFCAIAFAFYGFGVYALVIQQIIASLIAAFLIWRISDWKPKLEFSWKELKKLSNFSFYVFAATSVNKVIQQLDALIIGKLFSPATLGFFSRANSLNNLITKNASGSITKVFFPA